MMNESITSNFRIYRIRVVDIQGVVIDRKFVHEPRCSRCYLLDNEDMDTESLEL